jgi:hypothetical protein
MKAKDQWANTAALYLRSAFIIHQYIILFFNGLMESKIIEANTHPPAGGFGW